MSDPASHGTAHRYAAYFAPAESSIWWEVGSRWIGRCAARGRSLPQPVVPGVSSLVQQRLTRAPRRYGWHATLKAPFALAPGVEFKALSDRLHDLCAGFEGFTLPGLKVQQLDDFLALVPEGDSGQLDGINAVAAACVTGLHALAATLSPAELQRRRAARLTPQEDALLLRWGYPFVLDAFRFHMSLTGALGDTPPQVVDAIEAAATQCFDALPACRFDSVALFAEPHPGADFELVEHMRLGR
jgi:hypothetical protein